MTTTTPAPARELTDWFPASCMPVRTGLYEVYRNETLGHAIRMLEWNGIDWSYPNNRGFASMSENNGDKWRGLKEPA